MALRGSANAQEDPAIKSQVCLTQMPAFFTSTQALSGQFAPHTWLCGVLIAVSVRMLFLQVVKTAIQIGLKVRNYHRKQKSRVEQASGLVESLALLLFLLIHVDTCADCILQIWPWYSMFFCDVILADLP